MRFLETSLPGVYVVESVPSEDERGTFARTYDRAMFIATGLDPSVTQCSISYSIRAHTLRGMHFQDGVHAEAKLVRCTRGSAFDVAVDARPDSPTYLRWTSCELSADNRRAHYIPRGFAHGMMTLEDHTELFYQISTPYVAESAVGLRWDEPMLGIDWPARPRVVSDRDRNFPYL